MARWVTRFECVKCRKALSSNERMYSSGTCPKCGHRGPDAATIVETIAIPVLYASFWERLKALFTGQPIDQ